MGNPFTEDSSDFLILDSRNIVDVTVSDAMLQIEKLGLDHYKTFVDK